MKKIKQLTGILLVCFAMLPQALPAQVQSSAGLKVVATGQLKLVFNDLSLVNEGEFDPGQGTVIFNGVAPARISGGKAVNFHNLVIGKTGKDLSLENDLSISGKLTLEQGNLQLNERTLHLGYTGFIEGERNEARITGGMIKANALLNGPRAVNPGNIGVEITSTANMGETEIVRGHVTGIATNGRTVIGRYYDIKPSQNANLRATLKFYYLDAELGTETEDALAVYSSKSGQNSWEETGKDMGDASINFIVKNEISQFHRFTLAGATNKALAQQSGKTFVHLFPNPTPGQFTVQLNSSDSKEAALNLYDQLGRLLERKKIQCRIGVNTVTWNIERYANGTYYLAFENLDLKTVKIVKD